jgi:hypothetical protein
MRLLDSRPAEERFADILKLCAMFLRPHGIEVASYLELSKKESVARAASALIAEAERKNALLPPGYWQWLHRLREEGVSATDEKKA